MELEQHKGFKFDFKNSADTLTYVFKSFFLDK